MDVAAGVSAAIVVALAVVAAVRLRRVPAPSETADTQATPAAVADPAHDLFSQP